MTAKKVEPKTRKVRVHEQRTYVDEEPVIEVEPDETEIVEEFNPIQSFLEGIDNSRSLTMKVYLLPNFYKDGKRSIRANERPFVTQFPFSNEDTQDYQQRIQQACPAGGMFQLELREGFQIVRVWEEPISPAPGYQASGVSQPQQNYPIIVNPAMQPAPVQQMNPADVMREHMTLAKDLVQMARDLQPPAPTINVGSEQQNGDRPFEDKLFETIIAKVVETDTKGDRVDKVLDALSGRHRAEPGWMETLVPLGIEAMKLFAPTINALAQRAAQNAQVAQPPGLTPTPQLGAAPSNELQEPIVAGEQQPPIVVDPVQADWFQVVIRMLEDCTRHVQLASVGGGEKSVLPSAEAVMELFERYPEQLGPTIQILLSMSPIEVLDSCAMMLDERGQAHITNVLKPQPAAAKWIETLQGKCKEILADIQQEEGTEPDTDVA